jgi:hypothetical protein
MKRAVALALSTVVLAARSSGLAVLFVMVSASPALAERFPI